MSDSQNELKWLLEQLHRNQNSYKDYEPGACYKDVCFVVDVSGSIYSQTWTNIKNMLVSIINEMTVSSDGTQVALMRFSEEPDMVIQLDQFNDNKVELLGQVYNLRKTGQLTYIGKALDAARTDCFQQGDRPTAPNLLVLISDGWSEDDPLPAAQALTGAGIEVIVVAVRPWSGMPNEALLKQIAPSQDNYLFMDGPAVLHTIRNKLFDKICEDRFKTCKIRKGVLIESFDGLGLKVWEEQKTLFTKWGQEKKTEVCKFMVRAVSTNDCKWIPNYQLEPLIVDWVGISWDKHPRKKKEYGCNYIITQLPDPVSVRKRGKCVGTPLTIETFPHIDTMSDGKTKITISREFNDAGKPEFAVRSECNYAVDWRPNLQESELDILIQARLHGEMQGICGDADGDIVNDWAQCDGSYASPDIDGSKVISLSCQDGPHQGQAIPGCTKGEN